MPCFICLRGGLDCIFSRCRRNTDFISRGISESSFLAESEKTRSILVKRSGSEDFLYLIKGVGWSLFSLNLPYFSRICPVYKHEFFILKHSIIGKDSLSNHLGLVSGIPFLNDPFYHRLVWCSDTDVHDPQSYVYSMDI